MPVVNVSISAQNGHHGITDASGKFHITVDNPTQKLLFTAMGYESLSLAAEDLPGGDSPVILLSKAYTVLKDVVIKGRRGKYRNKNNPAVELIRKVIANKGRNGPKAEEYSAWREYEKIRMMVDKVPRLLVDNILLKKYKFIFDNKDSTIIPGKSLIPVYIQEVYSDNYARRHPDNNKKIVIGQKSVDFGEYIDMKGISSAFNRLYEDINLYDNTIDAFTMQFVSPVADLAPTFYMYFIRDTIVENGERLVELYFTPRNPEDPLFRGTLFITLDGNYAIRKAELGVSKHVNLNYVREFNVKQDFEKGPGDRYHLVNSDMIALLSPWPKGPGVVGERVVNIKELNHAPIADSIFKGLPVDTLRLAGKQTDSFWTGERSVALSPTEAKTYSNTDSLVKMRSYRRLMDYATAFTAGYKSVGKIDVGQIASFYTFNHLEGQRLKLGGRTNTKMSTSLFGEAYGAYGTKDQRWKYFGALAYAFNHKSIYTYPQHYVQVSYLNDTRALGQENAFAVANNFFTSFSHGINSEWLYNRIVRLSYIHELPTHLTYSFAAKYWEQSPAGSLLYIYKNYADKSDTVSRITTNELSGTLRWAPHEQFFQNKAGRVNIVNHYPIITLQYGRGIKGAFGGQYNFDALHLNVYKRCYIAPLGYSDITLDAGYLGGTLPFPLLTIHPANTSYFYTQTSYNMMNVGEFVSDHYAGIDIDHFFNGFFFNKIPGLKWLRLREVVAGKILYGGLRDANNPAINLNQMKFPLINGVTSTYSLSGTPYIEGSVGVYNIFTLFRLDLVKRFTYLNHPNVSSLGLRISSNFNF
ncbi:membrane protein [Puia dinghuensis]|uniref:Membrane protein n=2 Tax=Puia dinghuensis TaxID=1792502 RepID=A0A8J2XTK6_9BACT|nr:membrane protein [Puia dinghuensis]